MACGRIGLYESQMLQDAKGNLDNRTGVKSSPSKKLGLINYHAGINLYRRSVSMISKSSSHAIFTSDEIQRLD
jgi:hypothetical protein